jgi:glyoxylase-like metal-dependent hydrolase (beta-lactamase superfamily II)
MVDKLARPAPLSSLDVGKIRITYLPDGDAWGIATHYLPGSNDALWAAHQELLDDNGKLVVSLGSFLIQTGAQKVIVDLGVGDATFTSPDGALRSGRLLDSLRQTGIKPADVNIVFFTHLHFDHVGWTAQQATLTFPNARHLAGQGEWDFWRGVTDEDLAAIGPDPETVQAPLEHRIESVADGQVIAPGVNVVASPGHTPGHALVVVSSGAERAIIFGDAIVCPLQLSKTELSWITDVDADLARQTRERIAAELEANPQTITAGGHFSNSVFGRMLPAKGKRWMSIPTHGGD